jgi:hypothetical protein
MTAGPRFVRGCGDPSPAPRSQLEHLPAAGARDPQRAGDRRARTGSSPTDLKFRLVTFCASRRGFYVLSPAALVSRIVAWLAFDSGKVRGASNIGGLSESQR